MPFDPDTPYNDLPLLPPKAELETKAVLRKGDRGEQGAGGAEGRGGFDSESGRPDQRDCVAGGEAVVGDRERRDDE